MSGETESNISGWTTDTLHSTLLTLITDNRVYFERLHAESERRQDEIRQVDLHYAESIAQLTAEATQSHLDSRRQWQDGHLDVHRIEKEAVDRASGAMDRRLEGMNEFRDQLRDQARDFVSRAEFISNTASGERAALADHDRLAEMVPRAEMNLQFDTLKSQLGAMQKALQDTTQLLATVRSRDAGRSTGTSEAIDAADRAADAAARNRSLLIGGLGLLLAMLSLVVGLFIGLRNHSNNTPSPTTPTTLSSKVINNGPTTPIYYS